MTKEHDDDVHPLDQDYTQSDFSEERENRFRLPEGNVLRAGVICFLVGLVSLLVTAVLLGVFQGVRSLETTGSYVHQVSMIMILVGGVLMLLGFRLGRVNPNGVYRFQRWRSILILLVVNVLVGWILPSVVGSLDEWMPQRLASLLIRFAGVFVAVIAAMGCLFHHGWWRGFCVGVFVATLDANFNIFNVMYGNLGLYGRSRGGYADMVFAEMIWKMQFSGMVGAIYANVVALKNTNSNADAGDDTVKPI
ncbi:MAG: hypothetical protein CMM07_10425 [Rhodopirellula sp.]|nr:hypothetical protein [Rhodopirellula sp.]